MRFRSIFTNLTLSALLPPQLACSCQALPSVALADRVKQAYAYTCAYSRFFFSDAKTIAGKMRVPTGSKMKKIDKWMEDHPYSVCITWYTLYCIQSGPTGMARPARNFEKQFSFLYGCLGAGSTVYRVNGTFFEILDPIRLWLILHQYFFLLHVSEWIHNVSWIFQGNG